MATLIHNTLVSAHVVGAAAAHPRRAAAGCAPRPRLPRCSCRRASGDGAVPAGRCSSARRSASTCSPAGVVDGRPRAAAGLYVFGIRVDGRGRVVGDPLAHASRHGVAVLFPTVTFAVFFLIVLPLSWALMPNQRVWRVFIVVASYVFYGWWDWRFVFLLAASTVVNHVLAVAIYRAPTQSMPEGAAHARGRVRPRPARVLQVRGLLRELVRQRVRDELPRERDAAGRHLLLHVHGDLVRRRHLPRRARAGVVHASSRSSSRSSRISSPARSCARASCCRSSRGRATRGASNVSRAYVLIVIGLFLKVVIANHLATHIVDQVFAAPDRHSSLEVLVGVYGYAVQIFADFCGYTNIAIGIALLLGFEFPQNFDAPYTAVTLQDFWRRWHMTLSRWLRDYLYIPLGGSRKGRDAHLRQPDGDDAARRAVARRRVDVRRVGRDPRRRSLRSSAPSAGGRRAPRDAGSGGCSRSTSSASAGSSSGPTRSTPPARCSSGSSRRGGSRRRSSRPSVVLAILVGIVGQYLQPGAAVGVVRVFRPAAGRSRRPSRSRSRSPSSTPSARRASRPSSTSASDDAPAAIIRRPGSRRPLPLARHRGVPRSRGAAQAGADPARGRAARRRARRDAAARQRQPHAAPDDAAPRAAGGDRARRRGHDRLAGASLAAAARRPMPQPKPKPKPGATRPVVQLPVFTAKKPLRVWVAGDSLAQIPGEALERVGGAIDVVGVESRLSTGLDAAGSLQLVHADPAGAAQAPSEGGGALVRRRRRAQLHDGRAEGAHGRAARQPHLGRRVPPPRRRRSRAS